MDQLDIFVHMCNVPLLHIPLISLQDRVNIHNVVHVNWIHVPIRTRLSQIQSHSGMGDVRIRSSLIHVPLDVCGLSIPELLRYDGTHCIHCAYLYLGDPTGTEFYIRN